MIVLLLSALSYGAIVLHLDPALSQSGVYWPAVAIALWIVLKPGTAAYMGCTVLGLLLEGVATGLPGMTLLCCMVWTILLATCLPLASAHRGVAVLCATTCLAMAIPVSIELLMQARERFPIGAATDWRAFAISAGWTAWAAVPFAFFAQLLPTAPAEAEAGYAQ